jgi:methionyl-tRNA formyltransferase
VKIALLCATRRGYLFLQKLASLVPGSEICVFSFREEPWEPPFMDSIIELTESISGTFIEAKQVGSAKLKAFWETNEFDLMLVVSWRYLLPKSIYSLPQHGTFVFHDSLLPTYRGFSPTVWAILNGEDHTGVSLFKIAEEVDAGDIVDQQVVPIGPDETIAEVLERVTQTYLELLERNIQPLLRGEAPLKPQDHSLATYTCKRLPEDNRLDWNAPTKRIYDLIRAVTRPYPGAYTLFNGQLLRVWSAKRVDVHYIGRVPGRVVEIRPGVGSVVLTGDGALLLTEVQLEEGKNVCASEILNSLSHTLV